MEKIIVEVGSVCTKVDKFDGKKIERIKEKTIQVVEEVLKKLKETEKTSEKSKENK